MPKTSMLFLAMLLFLPAGVFGGWVETGNDGSRTFLDNGRVKEISPDDPVWSVIDLRSGSLLLVDTERGLSTETTVADYCRTMSDAVRASMEAMSPDERAVLEELAGQAQEDGGTAEVTVVGTGPGGTVAGLETEKYQVLVDGDLYQELWIAPNAPIMQEIGPADLRRLTSQIERCTENLPGAFRGRIPEQDPAYRELEARGWLMRVVTFSEGEAIGETEVASHERRKIPAAEFQPPPGFRRVPIRTFLAEE